jgi:ubiquinone/menaquinone biosynthesis C-methylase UbiE
VKLRPRHLLLLLIGCAMAFVAEEAVRTIWILDAVERDRDRWQRPEAVIEALDLHAGQHVVDLGSGAGYFTLKIAPFLGPGGQVVAVDLRRQPLAFLWIRAQLRGLRNVRLIVGAENDPRLPDNPVDAVLIVNTYHELSFPDAVLARLSALMRPGGRLVIADRAPRRPGGLEGRADHEIPAEAVVQAVERLGFHLELRNKTLVDVPGDEDTWWLLAFTRP